MFPRKALTFLHGDMHYIRIVIEFLVVMFFKKKEKKIENPYVHLKGNG